MLAKLYRLGSKISQSEHRLLTILEHGPDVVGILDDVNTIRFEGKLDLNTIRFASELIRDLQRLFDANDYSEKSYAVICLSMDLAKFGINRFFERFHLAWRSISLGINSGYSFFINRISVRDIAIDVAPEVIDIISQVCGLDLDVLKLTAGIIKDSKDFLENYDSSFQGPAEILETASNFQELYQQYRTLFDMVRGDTSDDNSLRKQEL